jgi:hypothetical protein
MIDPMIGGWTEDQIRNYPMEDLDAMIRSAKMSVDTLKQSLDGEEARLADLKRIRERKTQLGAI